MDGGAWLAAVHGVAKSRTQLSNFTLTFHFHALEKEMATHSSVLAWRIPGTGEPGGLPSMGSHRVGQDWSDLAYICPLPLEPPSHLPPHPTPLGYHRALDLSSLHDRLNFNWLSNFTYGNVYVSMLLSQFVPPFPSPPCPQVCSLCLWLHCCPASRFMGTIFLLIDSIYLH